MGMLGTWRRTEGSGGGRPVSASGSGDYLLALLDRRLAFAWVNEAFARAAGRCPETLLARGFFEIYPNPANEAIFRGVLETGRPFAARSGLGRVLRLSEHSGCRWDCELNPTRSETGTITGLVLVLRDVTSRVQLEREALLPAARTRPAGGAPLDRAGHWCPRS